uniref:ABC transporter domain-containing protein n=1 Tax=Cyclophora tenuis TaxID=216820 RepID=A0A7S1DB38_CYCTE
MSYRELKRLDSVNRSPIYSLFGETLDGVSTIRAYAAQDAFGAKLEAMLDRQQHAYYLTSAAKCWLAIRLELVGTLVVGLACLCAVLEHRRKGGGSLQFAGLAGLSISLALKVTQDLAWSVRMASDLETYMVSVERIAEYCKIKSEAPRKKLMDSAVPKNWPGYGEVQFMGVQLRYRPGLPLLLKGLDLVIPAGSKVGVVGRAGSGKSALVLAMLRIVELEAGKILLDGIDHRVVGLQKLRSRIAVIPQDPVLFSGSVKSNLDPFEEHSEDVMLAALSRVGLYSHSSNDGRIRSLLDHVEKSGSNFSVGQRQLLVLARALLTGASIVLMEEAASALDAQTDQRIQAVMKNEFAGVTCITVAHRLHAILDNRVDYVLVMEDGKVAEFDQPEILVGKDSQFKELVQAARVGLSATD